MSKKYKKSNDLRVRFLQKIKFDFNAFCKFVGFEKTFNAEQCRWAKLLSKKGKNKRIVQLMAHRSSHKSTLSALVIARCIFFNPNVRVCLLRARQGEAIKQLNLIKRFLDCDNVRYYFRKYYGIGRGSIWLIEQSGKLLIKGRNASIKEATIEAVGGEQKVTGSHFDVICCDDLTTMEDYRSPAVRERNKEVISEFATNILQPDGLFISVGTFWHADDAMARLSFVGAGLRDVDFEERRRPIGTVFTDISDEKLEAEKQDKKLQLGNKFYYANYLLSDYVDSNYPFGVIEHSTFMPKPMEHVFATLDTGFGNHPSALSIGYYRPIEDAFICYGVLFTKHLMDDIDAIADEVNKAKVRSFFVETNADKGAGMRALHELVNCRVEGINSTQNKNQRIQNGLGVAWRQVKIDTTKTRSDYIVQLKDWTFQSKKNDDAPDSLNMLIDKLSIERKSERGGGMGFVVAGEAWK